VLPAVLKVRTGPGLPARSGVSLKPEHFRDVLATRPDIGFFEVHAEIYMVEGGPFHHFLGRIREHYSRSLHGVGLSIGAEGPLDETHLDRLDALIRRYQPASFSEQLAWSSHGGVFLNDLLPVPYDRPTLERVCEHVDRMQERLQRQTLLENPSTYLEFEASTMDEGAFLNEVIRHGSPVDEAVWGLYAAVLARTGPTPTLLERDNDVPSLATLLAEAQRAEDLMPAPAKPERCRID